MRPKLNAELIDKIKPVRLAVFDVDGILTEGRLNFLNDGTEFKSFNILDGLGLKLLMNSGIETAIITGRTSPQVLKRAESLGINHLQQGREDKLEALKELWARTGFSAENTAYMGDDLPDLGAIRAARFGATVPNGYWFVREHADWCSTTPGGQGAVREFCDLVMCAQGSLDSALENYL